MGVCFVAAAKKLKIIRLNAVAMFQLSRHDELGGGALHVRVGVLKMARGVRQQPFDDFDAVELTQKVGMPKTATKLAVGYPLQTDIFLHFDGRADAAVLDLS